MFREPVKPLVDPPKPVLDFLSEAADSQFKVNRITHDHYQIFFHARELRDGTAIRPELEEVDRAFETFRQQLTPYSFVATLEHAEGEALIRVERRRDPAFRSSRLNWILFAITLATVQLSGALSWASYLSPPGPNGTSGGVDWLSLEGMGGGFLFFTVPLMGIIGLHEMGHFFTARHYGVRASLPFFLPNAPPLGTFGAAISLRDPFPNRKVAFDVGLSGPVIGFAAAILVTFAGVLLMASHPSPTRPESGGFYYLGEPLIFTAIVHSVSSTDSYLHPTLFAGWAGFLVTAFNLVPAAQLDGGHVLYALLKNHPRREQRAMWISIASVALIAGSGVALGYPGWIPLAIIVLITLRHPPPLNQVSVLGWKRIFAGAAALGIFLISFAPVPVIYGPPDYAFAVAAEPTIVQIPAGGYANYSFSITNEGNTFNPIEVAVASTLGTFTAVFNETHERTVVHTNKLEWQRVQVNVTMVSLARLAGEDGAAYLLLRPMNDLAQPAKVLIVHAHSVPANPSLQLLGDVPSSVAAGTTANISITARNTGDVPLNLSFNASQLAGGWLYGFSALGNFNASTTVAPGVSLTLPFLVQVPSGTPTGARGNYTIQAEDATYPGTRATLEVDLVVA